jgi:hypothetical protein
VSEKIPNTKPPFAQNLCMIDDSRWYCICGADPRVGQKSQTENLHSINFPARSTVCVPYCFRRPDIPAGPSQPRNAHNLTTAARHSHFGCDQRTSPALNPGKQNRTTEQRPKSQCENYRKRPGGSASSGIPATCLEFSCVGYLLGTGCGIPIPRFSSQCSFEHRGQYPFPVSSSRMLASS